MSNEMTIAEILADFDRALLALQQAEADAQDEIDAIDRNLMTRKLTPVENERRARLRAIQSAAQDATIELSGKALRDIDSSTEVAALRNGFATVIDGLKRARRRIETIARVAQAAAKAIAALEDVLPKLAKLAL